MHTDADAMEAEIAAVAAPPKPTGYRRLRHWLAELYRVEIGTFIDAQLRLPAGPVAPRPRPARARSAASVGSARRSARFLHDKRLQTDLLLPGALRGRAAGRRARPRTRVIAYMDTVAGVWFPRGGMRRCRRRWPTRPPTPGAEFRYGTR